MNLTGYLRDNTGIFIIKSPTANLVYALDFVDYLSAGDSLSTATVTIGTISGDPSPLQFPTNSATDVNISGTKATFRLSGGTVDKIYPITVTITTTGGDTDSRRFRIVCKNKELL